MRTTQRIATTMWALALVGLSAAPLGAQTTEGKDGPQEGIKVHGHWTITVRNADGTIASSREFENALIPGGSGGARLLSLLLTANAVMGRWIVEVGASTGQGPCIGGSPSGVACSASPSSVGLTPTTFQLMGTMRADRSGAIDTVRTLIEICDITIAPGACSPATPGAHLFFSFSGTTITSAIAVRQNQLIEFTVDFSFS